jgi:hypothetical protein
MLKFRVWYFRFAGLALGSLTALSLAVVLAAANSNSAGFSHGGCNWRANSGYDTSVPVGDASTDNASFCNNGLMHATGHFWTGSAYVTQYSGWVSSTTHANVVTFYWNVTSYVWDDSLVQMPIGTYSSVVSVLAN